jgi:hypothetical protein
MASLAVQFIYIEASYILDTSCTNNLTVTGDLEESPALDKENIYSGVTLVSFFCCLDLYLCIYKNIVQCGVTFYERYGPVSVRRGQRED